MENYDKVLDILTSLPSFQETDAVVPFEEPPQAPPPKLKYHEMGLSPEAAAVQCVRDAIAREGGSIHRGKLQLVLLHNRFVGCNTHFVKAYFEIGKDNKVRERTAPVAASDDGSTTQVPPKPQLPDGEMSFQDVLTLMNQDIQVHRIVSSLMSAGADAKEMEREVRMHYERQDADRQALVPHDPQYEIMCRGDSRTMATERRLTKQERRMRQAALSKKRVVNLFNPPPPPKRRKKADTTSGDKAHDGDAAEGDASTSKQGSADPDPQHAIVACTTDAQPNKGKQGAVTLAKKMEVIQFWESLGDEVSAKERVTMLRFPESLTSSGMLGRWRTSAARQSWHLLPKFVVLKYKEVPLC